MAPIPHRQMGGTADGPALRQHLPAEAVSELGPHTQPPRLNAWQRLKRWWSLGKLKAELADLQADARALECDLSDDATLRITHPDRWLQPDVQRLHAQAQHQLEHVEARIAAKRAAITRAGGTAP